MALHLRLRLATSLPPSNPLFSTTFNPTRGSRLFSTRNDGSPSTPSVPSYLSERLLSLCVPSPLHPRVLAALKQGGLSSKSALKSFPDDGLKQITKAIMEEAGFDPDAEEVTVKFKTATGQSFEAVGWSNETILDMSKRDVVLSEFLIGSCNGTMSCSTCHVYLSPDSYQDQEKRGEGVSEGEMDMLDLAAGFEKGRSRLGCAVKVREGIEVEIPEECNDYW